MEFCWLCMAVNLALISYAGSSPAPILGGGLIHQMVPRSVDDNVTATEGSIPTATPDPDVIRLIKVLGGSLGAAIVFSLFLVVVVVVVVIWGLRMHHRRREQRDLVLRTKHDIFEGVSNAMTCESDATATGPSPTNHNVIDSSPEASVFVASSCESSRNMLPQ